MSYGGIAATTAAVAARRRRIMLERRAEEEEMTHYAQEELDGEWEFKIVRSVSGAFRKPGELQKLVDEEARAGWVMLEKFDDHRVRFKRPHSARTKDTYLPAGVDPYRTHYGSSFSQYNIMILLVAAGLALLSAGGVVLFLVMAMRP